MSLCNYLSVSIFNFYFTIYLKNFATTHEVLPGDEESHPLVKSHGSLAKSTGFGVPFGAKWRERRGGEGEVPPFPRPQKGQKPGPDTHHPRDCGVKQRFPRFASPPCRARGALFLGSSPHHHPVHQQRPVVGRTNQLTTTSEAASRQASRRATAPGGRSGRARWVPSSRPCSRRRPRATTPTPPWSPRTPRPPTTSSGRPPRAAASWSAGPCSSSLCFSSFLPPAPCWVFWI